MEILTRPTQALVLTLLAVAACDGGNSRATGWSSVRDSAGITIVENWMPDGNPLGWTVTAAPTLSIGSTGGSQSSELFQVVGAAKLSNGRILIANAGTSELKVFEADGTFLEAWGGPGEGPGEFSSLGGVAPWVADSVAVWEASGDRITIFDSGGHPSRTIHPRAGNNNLPAPPVSVCAAGQLIVAPLLQLTPANIQFGMVSMPRRYSLLGPAGETLADLGEFPSQDLYIPENLLVTPHPFGKRTLAEAWGTDVVIGVTNSFALQVFDREGRLSKIVRLSQPPAPVTQKDIDRWKEQWLADAEESRRPVMRSVADALPVVPTLPTFSALRTDSFEFLWIQDYQRPGEERVSWTVFDKQGRILGRVETPRAHTVLQIGRDYLLTLATDELGVERVESWPLRRETVTNDQ